MAVSKLNPAAGGIPYGDTANRPANAEIGKLYSNGETARLELYTETGWQNIVQETPGVASASGHYYESEGEGTFIVSGTNFVDGAIAYAVGTNGTEYQATTTTYNSLVQLTVLFEDLSTLYEPYDIKITNPSNLFGLLPDAFYVNDSPVWGTASGTLGTYPHGSVSIQLASTDDESAAITYSLASGSLPSGLSLSSGGLISGTNIGAADTYNFVVTADDGFNEVSRSFSLVSTGPVVTGGTLSSDSTYYYRTFKSNGTLSVTGNLSADSIMVAGGGAGGNHMGGGGGAGGLLVQSSTLFATASYTVTIGSGGANSGSTDQKGSNGVNSSIIGGSISMSAIGGGAAGAGNAVQVGSNGGSGGGNSGYTSAETAAGNGTTGQGKNGGVSLFTGSSYLGTGGGGYSSNGGRGTDNGNTTWTAGVGGSGYILSSGYASASGLSSIAGGGGGGAVYAGYLNPTFGGSGSDGGGNGAGWQSTGSTNGTTTSGATNTGGGGGAARYDATDAGNGGSGMVIVRYTKASVGG